jgi:membrane-bound metal-dependent hydrolase YbcI (DUF457 family)
VLVLEYESLLVRFGVPLLIGAFVWFGFGWFFKKLTKHRGMFHSIPAVCIAALIAFITLRGMLHDEHSSVLIAIAVGVGYLSHLVLDEMYSSVSINGNPFRPRRSLGSALKLLSSSNVANAFAYTLLVILLYIAL